MPIRAVIFDVGGVLTTSPVVAIRQYAEREGIDYRVLGPMIGDHDLAWSRWERNELSRGDFEAAFEAEALERGVAVSAAAVQEAAFGQMSPRPEMIAVVRYLRGRVRLGCITNNVVREGARPDAHFDIYELFEHVIESSKAGLRKPNPRIYRLSCEALGVAPEEAAFLDDIGANLKGARAIGMTTIRVDEALGAIDELEAVLGFPLPRA